MYGWDQRSVAPRRTTTPLPPLEPSPTPERVFRVSRVNVHIRLCRSVVLSLLPVKRHRGEPGHTRAHGHTDEPHRYCTGISAPVKYCIEPSISLLYFIAFSSSRKGGGIGRKGGHRSVGDSECRCVLERSLERSASRQRVSA